MKKILIIALLIFFSFQIFPQQKIFAQYSTPEDAEALNKQYKSEEKTASGTVELTNPVGFENIEEFLNFSLGRLRGIIVVLSLIFIVLGGILYITSAGNDNRMKAAKGAITASLLGLAIGIAAPSFLREIYEILGVNKNSGVAPPDGPSLTQISLNVLNFLLSITGIVALIMLIIGGITYVTSTGDDDRIKTGKKIVTWSIVGIAIALGSLVIVKQIANLLK